MASHVDRTRRPPVVVGMHTTIGCRYFLVYFVYTPRCDWFFVKFYNFAPRSSKFGFVLLRFWIFWVRLVGATISRLNELRKFFASSRLNGNRSWRRVFFSVSRARGRRIARARRANRAAWRRPCRKRKPNAHAPTANANVWGRKISGTE